MKRIALSLSMFSMLFVYLNVGVPSTYAANNQKVGITVHLFDQGYTLEPGGYVSVNVGLYNTKYTDKKGLKSAEITISYDENVFEASDDLLRYDENLGKYIWRDDNFLKGGSNLWADRFGGNFTVTNPYPLDLDAADGRKEVRFTAVSTAGHYFSTNTLDPENFLSFNLKVKDEALLKKTAITVLPKETTLRDSSNAVINSFYYKSAHFSIEKPISLSIVKGTMSPTTTPFVFHVGGQAFLNARANFSNGDFIWTYRGIFESSDPSVATVTQDGSISAVGLGSTWITFTSAELTTKKRIDVVSNSVVIQPENDKFYYYTDRNPYVNDQQILLNGEDVGLGCMIGGSIYAPLKTIGLALGGDVGYDSVKKAPTFNGKAVTQYKVIGRTTYLKVADLKSLVGATITWDKKNKILSIAAKTQI